MSTLTQFMADKKEGATKRGENECAVKKYDRIRTGTLRKLHEFAKKHGCKNPDELVRTLAPIFQEMAGWVCLTGYEVTFNDAYNIHRVEHQLKTAIAALSGEDNAEQFKIQTVSLSECPKINDTFLIFTNLLRKEPSAGLNPGIAWGMLEWTFNEGSVEAKTILALQLAKSLGQPVAGNVAWVYFDILARFIAHSINNHDTAKNLKVLIEAMAQGYLPFAVDTQTNDVLVLTY